MKIASLKSSYSLIAVRITTNEMNNNNNESLYSTLGRRDKNIFGPRYLSKRPGKALNDVEFPVDTTKCSVFVHIAASYAYAAGCAESRSASQLWTYPGAGY
ncbi:hypothetical protein WA026_015608 [Henosepilachna vigintioctopunctata]|uniref:Uncharacterized protein n=1 Tax=Henosepilachna vigintioctopunctata TaxID=420089 RepID=A0AAW1VDN5_9CUCU